MCKAEEVREASVADGRELISVLRDCPGGYVEVAESLASGLGMFFVVVVLFLPAGICTPGENKSQVTKSLSIGEEDRGTYIHTIPPLALPLVNSLPNWVVIPFPLLWIFRLVSIRPTSASTSLAGPSVYPSFLSFCSIVRSTCLPDIYQSHLTLVYQHQTFLPSPSCLHSQSGIRHPAEGRSHQQQHRHLRSSPCP